MKRLVALVVSFLVALAVALTPAFAGIKPVPKPDKVKAVRDAEEAALDRVFGPWLKVAGGKTKEIKPVYDRMIAEWEKLVQSGNYVALTRYADFRSRYAKTEADHLSAISYWQAARKAAKTTQEAEETKNGFYVATLRLFVYLGKTEEFTPKVKIEAKK